MISPIPSRLKLDMRQVKTQARYATKQGNYREYEGEYE